MRKIMAGLTLLAAGLFLMAASTAIAAEKLMIYTSMKDSMWSQLQAAFNKKYPDVAVDTYIAGAGKLMAKIATERQSGKIIADILWTSEIPDFYALKRDGLLESYLSPEAKTVQSPVKDPDGCFTPVRLGTLGLAYNTKKVTVPPRGWPDMMEARFKDGFGIANPALSGTACVSVAMISGNLGWDYFEKIKKNGAKMGHGSGQVVDDTASGDLKVSVAVDYITIDKMKKGANLGLFFPKEMLVIPSPVAIFKGSPNLGAAKKMVDFLLTLEGQTIVAANGTLPVRADVKILEGFGLVQPNEAVERAMKIDYLKMMQEKEAIIEKFTRIMRAQ
ncbi:MAG: ABC transporter substrate-binding protein [Thermodesulfobacteriota bacterium]